MREVLPDTHIVARLAEKTDPSHLLVADDVRLAACAMANGVGEILTLHTGDYANIAGIAPPSP